MGKLNEVADLVQEAEVRVDRLAENIKEVNETLQEISLDLCANAYLRERLADIGKRIQEWELDITNPWEDGGAGEALEDIQTIVNSVLREK